MQKQLIKDLNDKDQIRSVFIVSDKQVLKDKNGKDYLNIFLADKTGSLNARMWDNVEEVSSQFAAGDFVKIKGHVQVYQSRKQIIVHNLETVGVDTIDVEDFLPSSKRDRTEMYEELVRLANSLEDKRITKLLLNVFTDAEKKELMALAPAAKSIHHAFVGGLMEHILSICNLMEFLASHYDFLNRDLLLFGAIFHDIGKLNELSVQNIIQYTDQGRLVGHMAIACEWVDTYSKGIDGFDQELKDILKHIILSHHGKLEFGSPKRPKFLEAYAVAKIDELDSQLDYMLKFMRSEIENDSKWTSYNKLHERYFYLEILRRQLAKKEDS